MKDLIIHNIGQLVTPKGHSLLKGKAMNEIETLKDAYIVIKCGKILEVGVGKDYNKYGKDFEYIDAHAKLVTPGLIDSHTHLVHSGSREHEFIMKLQGADYLDILKAGGGILNTVSKTREAELSILAKQAITSLERMLEFGVTTVEAKSGYGLNLESELKQLEVVKKLNDSHPINIVSTFMGAHAIPIEYKDRKNEYIKEIKRMLEVIKGKNLAKFCDIFCEDGVFSLDESRDILEYAKFLGYQLKIHADEIVRLGGASLAAELSAISAEHLMKSNIDDYKAMASNNVTCIILPLTSFYLNKPFANARGMIDNGCGVAIATDYNPGTSPSENLNLAMQIAAMKLKLTPNEVLTAVTLNAAAGIDLAKTKGSIEVGKDADIVIYNCDNLEYLFYHFGVRLVDKVIINGKLC